MSRAHYRAIEAHLKELILSGKTVPGFLGDPPANTVLPYTFITPVPAPAHAENVAGSRDVLDAYFNVTCVHTTANNCLALTEKMRELLDDWTPTVDGWRTFPLEPVDAQPVQTSTTAMEMDSNSYPRWSVTQYRLQACKENN
ncbi:MAG: hypothetical protein LKJ18_01910 [Ancrocorticia sp.]|jgi:hypothetical protein|nr:hypothetical protein [Ancrocorticia sp.]MCI1962894.1 hypothetical protein [Ancrocorticia sp.]MCI2001826.1 hypothetical protein [Ancrocorticia sp.]MCI2001879.1 hypothetical protein [Ancrocorticia sp.]